MDNEPCKCKNCGREIDSAYYLPRYALVGICENCENKQKVEEIKINQ